ncbi:hypothetical protein ACFL9T_09005, partial [Thermodesulfobacteriota bacterium]
MDARGCFRMLFLVLSVLIVTLLSTNTYAQNQEPVSQKEIGEIVDLMEDPNKREAFLRNLKNLQRLKEPAPVDEAVPAAKPTEVKKRPALAIENLFVRFEYLSEKIVTAAASTASLVTKTPQAYINVKSFFSDQGSLLQFLKLLANVALAVVIAFLIGLFLRTSEKRLTERSKNRLAKISLGIPRLILKLLPYLALITCLFFLFRVFPSYPVAHALALLLFTVLFFYRMALEVFRILLAPDESRIRILSVNDENANYLWVWVLRFTNYSAFYFLVTRALTVVDVDIQTQSFIKGLLLIIFPFMISFFILQIAREIRAKFEALRQKNEENSEEISTKTAPMFVRYWPILAMAYVWAIFLFLIVNFDKGFGYLFAATLWTAVTIIGVLLALRIKEWLFEKFFTINEKVKERFPGLEAKTNRYILILKKAMKTTLIIIGIGIIAQ